MKLKNYFPLVDGKVQQYKYSNGLVNSIKTIQRDDHSYILISSLSNVTTELHEKNGAYYTSHLNDKNNHIFISDNFYIGQTWEISSQYSLYVLVNRVVHILSEVVINDILYKDVAVVESRTYLHDDYNRNKVLHLDIYYYGNNVGLVQAILDNEFTVQLMAS